MRKLSELGALFRDRANVYFILALLCIIALVLIGLK